EIQNPVSQALYNPRLFCCLQSYCQSNVLEAYTRLRKVAKLLAEKVWIPISFFFFWKFIVFMIVVTNGSRFPGLGGLGVHGTGIAIRKLDMYVAAVVISPHMI
ncbi:hypothetical protein HN51_067472, partial [Arachis hypogaea]